MGALALFRPDKVKNIRDRAGISSFRNGTDDFAGKGGQQRGTSRREDLLDPVIALRQPEDYCPTEGLRAQIRFEKARSFFGDDARPFEVRMEIKDGAALWTSEFVVEGTVPFWELGTSALANPRKSGSSGRSRTYNPPVNRAI